MVLIFFSGSKRSLGASEISCLLNASFEFSSDSGSESEHDSDEFAKEPKEIVDVVLHPPKERGDAVSDRDSDDEDHPTGDRVHLPARILQAGAEVVPKKRKGRKLCVSKKFKNSEPEPCEEEKSNAYNSNNWSSVDPKKVGTKVPSFSNESKLSEVDKERLDACKRPIDYYKLLNTDQFLSQIVHESQRYALQMNNEKAVADLTLKNLRCVEATILHSGYHVLPSVRMLWEEKKDCHNEFVAESIRRKTFENVLHNLHFVDNTKMTEDPYYKVRPIFENLNRGGRFLLDGEEHFSVDEVMVPYFGRHHTKQYIHGKPIRYGYKIWCLATSGGGAVRFEPYCGAGTKITDYGLGCGPNVVLDLIKKAELAPGTSVTFDNLFTSFPLLQEMSEMGIGGTGTVRQNRLGKVPIPSKQDIEKKTVLRGFSTQVFNNDISCVVWKDSKAVYTASNLVGGEVTERCKRFDRTIRKSVLVQIPDQVRHYNATMGGVDLLDQQVALYRSPVRVKKWWFPFYTWSLHVLAVNAWRIEAKHKGHKIPYLSFLRDLVIEMMEENGTPRDKCSKVNQVAVSKRLDGMSHWPAYTDNKKRRNCRQCTFDGKRDNKTNFICSKCEIPLHVPSCFQKYHEAE